MNNKEMLERAYDKVKNLEVKRQVITEQLQQKENEISELLHSPDFKRIIQTADDNIQNLCDSLITCYDSKDMEGFQNVLTQLSEAITRKVEEIDRICAGI